MFKIILALTITSLIGVISLWPALTTIFTEAIDTGDTDKPHLVSEAADGPRRERNIITMSSEDAEIIVTDFESDPNCFVTLSVACVVRGKANVELSYKDKRVAYQLHKNIPGLCYAGPAGLFCDVIISDESN